MSNDNMTGFNMDDIPIIKYNIAEVTKEIEKNRKLVDGGTRLLKLLTDRLEELTAKQLELPLEDDPILRDFSKKTYL